MAIFILVFCYEKKMLVYDNLHTFLAKLLRYCKRGAFKDAEDEDVHEKNYETAQTISRSGWYGIYSGPTTATLNGGDDAGESMLVVVLLLVRITHHSAWQRRAEADAYLDRARTRRALPPRWR